MKRKAACLLRTVKTAHCNGRWPGAEAGLFLHSHPSAEGHGQGTGTTEVDFPPTRGCRATPEDQLVNLPPADTNQAKFHLSQGEQPPTKCDNEATVMYPTNVSRKKPLGGIQGKFSFTFFILFIYSKCQIFIFFIFTAWTCYILCLALFRGWPSWSHSLSLHPTVQLELM